MVKLRLVLFFATLGIATSSWSQTPVTVRGRVTTSDNSPVANADVTLRPLPPAGIPAMPRMDMPGMTERTTKADATGNFSFTGVTPGEYILQADASGFERTSQQLTVNANTQPVTLALQRLEIPGAEAATLAAGGNAADVQALLDRVKTLEQRLSELEAGTVLSEPETRVKRTEVYVDANGVQHDEPVPGAKPEVTYQRERVFRRQTINEKIEEAIADAENRTVRLGVSAATVTQFAQQTEGIDTAADGHAYQLASADLFFTATIAQYTSFFADIVGLSGAPPDAEIPALTLLNSYTARLVAQNQINLREAWVRTELFSQRLGITAGRVDLTNVFDRNAAANDETSQFVADALVNNPMLGLASNGTGVVGVFDPKSGLVLKGGLQQSNDAATSLSDAIFLLGEVDYVARPPGLSEGNYRLWVRSDNSTGQHQNAFGISADQKLTPLFTAFARFGSAEAAVDRDEFYSLGVQIQNGLNFNPLDVWGVGYSQTDLDSGDHEKIAEGYYNFRISERLHLSFHLQHAFERPAAVGETAFLLPVIRLQASF